MNILRVSSYPTIDRPGMGLHPYYLCTSKSAKTYFLTPRTDETRVKLPPNTELIERTFFSEVRPRKESKLKQFLFTFRRVVSIVIFSCFGAYLLIRKKIDVVHIHSPMFTLIALFGFLFGKKVFITFHGSDYHRIQSSKLYAMFSFIYDEVFCISGDMIARMSELHGHEKVHLVNNGIDTDAYYSFGKERRKQFVAVGALKEEKAFDVLIDSFAKFIDRVGPGYRLVIAGEGRLRDGLTKQIKSLGLSKDIELVGHLGKPELVDLYNQSEIFVLSSRSEGFPKVLLESMACGCKVVATRVGSVPTVLSDYPYVVNPDDVESLSEAMLSITGSESADVKNSYKKIISKYNWDAVTSEYEAFI